MTKIKEQNNKSIGERIKNLKKDVEKISSLNKKVEKIEKFNNKENSNKNKKNNNEKMYVIPIGGLEEVGKNTTLFQYKDEIILVDAGAIFPDENLPGIDLVIPDYTFVEKNKEKIKGVFITHGHEDHIGGLPYLYEKIDKSVPIIGGKLTNALIKEKFYMANGENSKLPKMKEVGSRSFVKVGKYFSVEFIRVTHSIADSYCLSIKTPAGHIFHTGDFKIDLTPVDGEGVDFARLAEIGEEGVDLMLSDSTNSEVDGFTPSEKSVGESLKQEFLKAEGRIIVAVFASHVHRIQQIVDIASKLGRKIAIDGRSLVKVFDIAPKVGCLKIKKDILVPMSKINKLADDKVLIICTGTQGEPLAALSRIARKNHKHIEVKEKDTIIISATPIPGNEKAVSTNINNLLKFDAEVVFKKIAGIHVSGHGSKEEQKLMLNLIKPKSFMPVHGEHRMLKAHKKTAMETGIDEKNILITQNGDKIEVNKKYSKIVGRVCSGAVLIDGLGVGDIGNSVIKDRQQLSQDGIVIVAYSINKEKGTIVAGPEIATKGFIYYKDSENFISESLELLSNKIFSKKNYKGKEWGNLKSDIKSILSQFFYEKTKRNPIILPIVTEI